MAMAFSGRLAASFARLSWYSWADMPGVTEIVSEGLEKCQRQFTFSRGEYVRVCLVYRLAKLAFCSGNRSVTSTRLEPASL